MSENPNPTRCGNCGTDNPPGQEFCITCGQPLTLTADAALLGESPERVDEPGSHEGERDDAVLGIPMIGGLGGAPLLMRTEENDQEQAPNSGK
jgi:hypothetical protein